MANGATPSVRDAGAAAMGRALGPAGLGLIVALGACSPVAAWRDLTGASKHDPNPAATPNTKNLAAGEASPYPNLATVPPPPTRELTQAELQHLTQSLVADRANAKYTDQQLRGGSPTAEPPPAPPAPAAGAAATALALAAAPSVPAAPKPTPNASPPIIQAAVASTRTAAGAAAPAAGAAAPAAIEAGPPEANAPATKPDTTASWAAPTAAAPNGMVSGLRRPGQPPEAGPKGMVSGQRKPGQPPEGSPNGMVSGLRKPGQPPAAGPMESSLVPPQIQQTPQPQTPVPPPPPPHLVAPPAATVAHLQPPAPVPIGAVALQPPPPPLLAPPPPHLVAPPPPRLVAPPAPTTAAMTPPPAGEKPPPAAPATPVAEITFAAGSRSLSGGDVEALKKVAARYREHPGRLRVVGYVWVVGAADPLTTFGTALDQAQAVAAALAKTGIPAAKIAAEAAPAKAAEAADHVEVMLEP